MEICSQGAHEQTVLMLMFSLPTFMIFKQGQAVETIQGADRAKLESAVRKLVAEFSGSSSGFGEASGSGNWRGGELPKGYRDVTDQVDIKGTELLNADGDFGTVRVLFNEGKPSALAKGKGAESTEKDWVESDTDEQLMLFVPFQSTLKAHTIQVCIFYSLQFTGKYTDCEILKNRSPHYPPRTMMTTMSP